MISDPICLCGSALLYKNCCEPFHDNTKPIETTEQLLRARYMAFVLRLPDFIQSTMANPALAHFDSEFIINSPIQWESLTINTMEQGATIDDDGVIDFTIAYRESDFSLKLKKMREKSLFQKIDGKWFYVDALKLQK